MELISRMDAVQKARNGPHVLHSSTYCMKRTRQRSDEGIVIDIVMLHRIGDLPKSRGLH